MAFKAIRRRTLLGGALLLLLVSGCANSPTPQRQVAGSGVVIAQPRALDGFSRIELKAIGDVAVTIGDEYSVLVSAEENFMRLLQTTIRGDWLVIETPGNTALNPTRPITFIITMPALAEVKLSGSGSIRAAELNAESLTTTLTGTGSVTLAGSIHAQHVKVAGAGSYDASHVDCHEAWVDISGVGGVLVHVSELLDATISGAGNVIYDGRPEVKEHITGFGAVIRR